MKRYLVRQYEFEAEEDKEAHYEEWIINEQQLRLMLESDEYTIAYHNKDRHVLDTENCDYTITIEKTPIKSKVTYNETVRG